MEAVNTFAYSATFCSSFLCLLQRREAKVNGSTELVEVGSTELVEVGSTELVEVGSTELVEVLGPTGSFGRDALRRVLGRRPVHDPSAY